MQQLALVYVYDLKFDPAMSIFDNLANRGDDEVELRAFGLAGKCVVLSLRGQYRESDAVLANSCPSRPNFPASRPCEGCWQARSTNRSQLGPQTAQEWDKWVEEQLHEGG